MKRSFTMFQWEGVSYVRAHVWTKDGYSSKTFLSVYEAQGWEPRK
jgi:hypothetical protein